MKINKPTARNVMASDSEGGLEMKCCAKDCSIDLKGFEKILGIFDDGAFKMVLCPNHQIMYVLGKVKHEDMELMPSSITERSKCELCDELAIRFEDSETTYELCSHHMAKLIRHNLNREEFSKLYLKHGNTFLLHDDFYEDDGEAIQPVK
jgi:hypothetical protein